MKQFAKTLLGRNEFDACYIAIIPADHGFDLEVEIDAGTIAGMFAVHRGLSSARKLADNLEAALTHAGVKVFTTREEWDGYLAGE